MDEFLVSFVSQATVLVNTIQLFILNLTLVQGSLAVGAFLFIVGVWFFSDGFDNWKNATSFIFSYAALCFLIVLAYFIITNPIFPKTSLPVLE